jgi:NTP pyrophosphatase (non-canonical NTP hydrolase)
MQLTNEFESIRDWAKERGLYEKGNVKTQFLKLNEEMGELSRSILKDDYEEYKDAIGDMVVVLTNMAHMTNTTIEECINGAYQQIKNRKGNMINGTFVKNVEQQVEKPIEQQSLTINYMVTDINGPYDGPFSKDIITYTLINGNHIIHWHEGPNKKLGAKVGDVVSNIVLHDDGVIDYKKSNVKIVRSQLEMPYE